MNENLTIEAAFDVFLAGFSATRSFTKPYDVTQLTSSLWRLADRNSNSKTARSAEYIALDCDSDKIEASIRRDSTPKHMLCVLLRRSEGLESDVLKIKTLGYRYLGHEPFYILNTSETIPRFDYPIQRVVEAEAAEKLRKASRQRLVLQSHLVAGDAHCRLYAAFERDVPIGWVRCIKTHGNRAWVGSLFVAESYRRRGIGSSLMSAMLQDDQRYGVEWSVLFSSQTGAKLYPRLGYKQIGVLLLFSPKTSPQSSS